MNKNPNPLQRFVIRIYMLPVLAPLWPAVHHHIDGLAFKLTNGRSSFTEILGGIAIIQLLAAGAKTGNERVLPLISIFDDEKIILVASNFGQQRNPSWYYNLKANPRCKVKYHEQTGSYLARETEGSERETYWQKAVSIYPGYENYRKRASHRRIPVMLLEPLK